MKKALLVTLFLFPALAYAALPPTDGAGTPTSVKITCYAPGADPNMEGPFATSRPGADGGGSVPYTLDDFRQGKSKYVTLAANPMHYGKWFNMGTVTYVSNLDGRRYTISNAVGYVHDTGCAFKGSGEKGSCCAKYNTCSDAYRKMDVAYGDFRANNANKGLVNSEAYCGNRSATWMQIGGPLTSPPSVSGGEYVSGGSMGGAGSQAPTSPTPPSYTQPPYSPPPPPQYAQQPSTAQPSSYFGNSYAPVPANQPFPAASNVTNSTTGAGTPSGSGTSLGQSLLNLIQPITSGIKTTNPVTVSSSTTGIGSISSSPTSGTQITITPVSGMTYSPPQTFVQTYLESPRPSANVDTATLSRMLESLKGALTRILEILRLR